MTTPVSRRAALGLGVVGAIGLLSACSSSPAPAGGAGAPSPGHSDGDDHDGEGQAGDPPIAHIHGVARDPRGGLVVLATHIGLFRLEGGALRASGPVIDLMSFTVAKDGSYLASGHPGPRVDMPEPVGLISSTDQGRTWAVLSRAGESDFHALAATPTAVVGFDGVLRVTTDRRTWTEASIPAPPRCLAAAPTTGMLLATTEQGLLLSRDNAATWVTLKPPQLLVVVAWADDRTIVGVGMTGTLVSSRDAGTTWTTGPGPLGEVSALGSSITAKGQVEVLAVVGTSLLRTVDMGAITQKLV